ncbi:Zinc finger protein ZAT9 [Apostasia shenzhenica]|uniref:Zinc finger protein ZAT9 n=1 Tax=Apostasia shenzhenica TaxID=1088818 RepID=A0A2I0BAX2_9ASPA|nr:Zinc finger protein ZAT9 [Apostasia shenzhenica]
MEKDKEPKKHKCRICSKCFPCGRSLGGHMRSHVHASCDDELQKEKHDRSRGLQVGALGASYGLRENPKKTWRMSDFSDDDPSLPSSRREKLCKECGREFPSWKALFGHMRCHSDKNSRRSSEAEEQHEQDQEKEAAASWSAQKVFFSSERDVIPSRKGRSKGTCSAIAVAAASSSSITEYEQELEDVAISLMMLSRGIEGYWASSAPASGESFDRQSMVFEEDAFKRSESGELGCSEAAEDSAEESRKRRNLDSARLGTKSERIDENGYNVFKENFEREYQCPACNKAFSSYQALGGHRASHKRIRGCCLPKNDNGNGGENSSFDTEASDELLTEMEETHPSLTKKRRIHECNICGKAFSSGQALGGHKRSHVVSNGETRSIELQMPAVAEVPELLDLNLPAPVDQESSNVKPWWAGGGIMLEQHLVSLTS